MQTSKYIHKWNYGHQQNACLTVLYSDAKSHDCLCVFSPKPAPKARKNLLSDHLNHEILIVKDDTEFLLTNNLSPTSAAVKKLYQVRQQTEKPGKLALSEKGAFSSRIVSLLFGEK